MSSRPRTITDFFCGSGGSSTGLVAIPGVEVVTAANHWPIALDTHAANHPNTKHLFGDLRIVHPSEFETTEAAWFSPECTKHSLARGKARKGVGWRTLWGDDNVDPNEERSRATMREVIEFTAYHRYKLVVVENVTEIRYWPHYPEWLKAMQDLGYDYKEVFLNSAHVGVPQSRDRIYVCFWLKGNKKPDLDIRPRCFCSRCGHDVQGVWTRKNAKKPLPGKVQYGKQYVYVCPTCMNQVVEPYVHPAAEVIDWWRPAVRIGDRAKPLSHNTMRRIQRGLDKYKGQWFTVDTAHSRPESDNGHLRSPQQVLPTITTAQSLGLAMPFMIDNKWHDKETAANLYSVEGQMPTIMTVNTFGLVQPPFVVDQYGRDSAHNHIDDPLSTITTINNHKSLVIPPQLPSFIAPYYGTDDSYEVTEPLGTITTKASHGLVQCPAPDIDDCLYRMIHVEELKRGMSFPKDYVILGSSDDVKTKQIGNAVTCYVATEIFTRMFDSLEAA